MLPTEDKRELELRDYLRIVRRRLPILILTVVLVVGAALSASLLQTPVYQGEAEVLLQTRSKETPFDADTGQRSDPQRAIQTEIKVITSQPVRAAVRRQLGRASEVSASPSGQTDIIEVKAESTDARQAAAVANAYANSYIDFKRRQAVEDLLAASKLIQDRVSALQKEIDSLPAPTPQRTDSRRDALVDLQAQFRQLTDQLQVNRQLVTGGAQLLSPAAVPSSPIKPRPKRNVVLALVGGLLLGFGLAFLFDYLDDSIKSKEDLERSVGALPTIGLIPAIGSWRDRDNPLVVSRSDPSSGPAEAYRTLRTSIHFLALDRPMHTVQITSSNASEDGAGRSTRG